MYQPIDQLGTGKKLKIMIETAGYDVKYIHNFLVRNPYTDGTKGKHCHL